MKIAIINFSGRRGGNCHDIAEFISVKHVQNNVTLLNMCDMDVNPCGKCGYECFSRDKTCPYAADDVAAIYAAVSSSDAAFYVVPNYSDYPCAYFFAFKERSQGIFTYQAPELYEKYLRVSKKFVVVSNTGQDNFRHAFKQHVAADKEPDVLFLAPNDFVMRSVIGGVMSSDAAQRVVADFV